MDTVKSLARGVVFFEKGPFGGWIPRRFTEAQLKTYAGHESFSVRAGASSGCVLELITDAQAFSLKFRCFQASSRDFYGFDLMLNGQLFAHLEDNVLEKPEGEWHVTLPEGEKELKIHFPNLAGVEIFEIILAGANTVKPTGSKRRILFMGDSITQGYTARFPSGTYAARVAQALNAEYLNQAIGGETFHPEILDENFAWNPELIVLAYGTNDWSGKTKEKFTSDCAEFLRRLTDIFPGTPVAMLTPIWRGDALTKRDDFSFEEAAVIMEELAFEYPQIKLIRGDFLVPQMPELMEDVRLHPNDLGFVYYAERLLERLRALSLA